MAPRTCAIAAGGESVSKRVSRQAVTVALSADSWLKSWLGTPLTVRPDDDFPVCGSAILIQSARKTSGRSILLA